VLEDDRHFFRILRHSRGGQLTPSAVNRKVIEEVMLHRQAVLGGVAQDTAQHAAQRVARPPVDIVSDMIGRHYQSCRVQMHRRARQRCPWPDSLFRSFYPGGGAEVQQALPPAWIFQQGLDSAKAWIQQGLGYREKGLDIG